MVMIEEKDIYYYSYFKLVSLVNFKISQSTILPSATS